MIMRYALHICIVPLFIFFSDQVSAQMLTNLASLPIVFTCSAQDERAVMASLDKSIEEEPKMPEKFTKEDVEKIFGPQPSPEEQRKWREQHRQHMKTLLIDSSWAACVRRKQWLSKELCTDFLALFNGGLPLDVRRAYEKHRQEINNAKEMFSYFETSFPKGGAEPVNPVPCPN